MDFNSMADAGKRILGIADVSTNEFEIHYSENRGLDTPVIWSVDGKDWYKTFPYRFEIEYVTQNPKPSTDASGIMGAVKSAAGIDDEKNPEPKYFYYTLPIPPQSLLIKPVIASRATPTIGGVVEETSAVTFWMINMAGVFAPAVGRVTVMDDNTGTMDSPAINFRDKITTTGLLAGVSATVLQSINKITGVADQLMGVAKNGLSGLTGVINDSFTPPLTFANSAVNSDSNGFTEAQFFVKFFYMYSKLKSMSPDSYSLYFTDFKKNQRWRIVVKDLQTNINSANPNLYRYQIALQGWDCQKPNKSGKIEVDRFGPKGDMAPVLAINLQSAKILGKFGNSFNKKK